MRVRLLTGLSGPNFNAGPGDEVDLDRDEAERLIAGNMAEPIEKTHKRKRKGTEHAVQPSAETPEGSEE